jgi:hypothetical protein
VVEVKSSEKQLRMETNGLPKLDNVIFGEIQVLLAEKRTALASLRTGIAVFALPLSVLSALIATSRYYSMEKVMSVGAAAALEPWSRCARHLARLPFAPPHSPLRESHPRAQRKISVNRGVYRIANKTAFKPAAAPLEPSRRGDRYPVL